MAGRAIKEMHRQVGDLVVDEEGIAVRGLLVRHLVMPNRTAGTENIAAFLAMEVSPDTYVNIMDQYRPCGNAGKEALISRRLTVGEFREARVAAKRAGLKRLDRRERPGIVFGF
jgi:putative pyruvate formate lyase activating enzyme